MPCGADKTAAEAESLISVSHNKTAHLKAASKSDPRQDLSGVDRVRRSSK